MKIFRLLLMIVCLLASISSQAVFCADEESELFLVAQRAFEDGFYDVSIRYIEDFQSKFPQSERAIQARLLLGQCYFFKNQYLKAFELFQKLTPATEYKDAVLFWLGETYLKTSDYAKAEEQYQQLIRIYPESSYVPQAYYSWAWVYFEQKKFSDAQEIYEEFIQKFPRHELAEDAHLKIAECKFKTFGTSDIWTQEAEITSYRDLILHDVSTKDFFRGHAWLIHSNKFKTLI